MNKKPPAPLLTRILIIGAMILIIAGAGLLVLLARSCGGDEPAPTARHGHSLVVAAAAQRR